MNRPGVGPQSLRGLPTAFSSQQQQTQQRSTSSRLPNGKMANNNTTWTFGGVPMGGPAVLPSQRSNNTALSSFAQSIASSQPATSLDLSEFPSLSNNQPQQASNNAWAMPGSRSLGQRTQQTQAQQQTQQQQEDLFSSSSQLPTAQIGFRFGNQIAVGQSSQSQGATSDEFPPLSRNINGDIGQDRGQGILPNVGFGAQSGGGAFADTIGGSQSIRGNGLLNALSGSNRSPPNAAGVTSPPGVGGLSASRSPVDPRQGGGMSLESGPNDFTGATQNEIPGVLSSQEQNPTQLFSSQPSTKIETTTHVQPHSSQQRSQQTNDFGVSSSEDASDDPAPDVADPLAGMGDKDRFGLKGLLSTLKGPYADQAALITGIDINTLGFDLNLTEKFSEQIWSPFDDAPARPAVPKHILPECYQIHNVQPVENKLSNFSDETLMFMFYSNPQDIQQMIAAQELTTRNWRYHKKAQVWLTKDDMMVPQSITSNTEQGYYIFFDPKTWSRERRHFVLVYEDLEAVPQVIHRE